MLLLIDTITTATIIITTITTISCNYLILAYLDYTIIYYYDYYY